MAHRGTKRAPRAHARTLGGFLLALAACGQAPSAEGEAPGAPPPAAPPASPAPAPMGVLTAPPGAAPSLEEALRAAPTWADAMDTRGEASGPNHRSTLPQGPDRAATFAAMPAGSAVIEGGLVACRVDVTAGHPWDSRGIFGRHVDPDITYRIHVGDGPQVTARGEEDERSGVIALPGITLRPGETLRIRAVDRDVGRDDDMGTVEIPFAGAFPITARGTGPGELAVECRGASRQWAEARAAASLVAADAPLAALGQRHPDLRTGEVVFPANLVADARTPLFEAASLLGWAHPGVRARVEVLDGAEARFRRELGAQVVETGRALPPGGQATAVAGGTVRIAEAGCDAGRAQALGTVRCFVVVEATLERGGEVSPTSRIVTAEGAVVPLVPSAVWASGRPQAVGVALPLHTPLLFVSDPGDGALSDTPAPPVVLVQHGGAAAVLRLR